MALAVPVMAIGLRFAAWQRGDRRLPCIGWRAWTGIHVAAFFLVFDLIVWH